MKSDKLMHSSPINKHQSNKKNAILHFFTLYNLPNSSFTVKKILEKESVILPVFLSHVIPLTYNFNPVYCLVFDSKRMIGFIYW